MKFFFLLTVTIFYFSLKNCCAQIQDFQSWSSLTLQKSFSKKFSSAIQQQLRLKDNSTQLRQTFSDVCLKYDVSKSFSVSVNYRFIIKPHEIDHRLYADVSYSLKKNKFTFTPRIRLQHDFVADFNDDNYLRGKLTLEYKITKKWKPFLAGELFYHALYYKGNQFDEFRLYTGTNFDFNKKNSFRVFYLLQQQFNVNAAQQNHVLGIGYEHDL